MPDEMPVKLQGPVKLPGQLPPNLRGMIPEYFQGPLPERPVSPEPVHVELPVADHALDLRGEVCPYVLVKTLLTLEGLPAGQVMRVLFDYLPALRSVPKSVEAYGHRVSLVTPLDEAKGEWQVFIVKAQRAAEPVHPAAEGTAEAAAKPAIRRGG